MADSKLADLTVTTALAETDIAYVVRDPSGTPVDRKITVGNLVGAMVASAHTTLTATSPNSLSNVQWGTEEATVAQADAPATAAVIAWLSGQMQPGPGSPAVNDRGAVDLQISIDGGSNFTTVGSTVCTILTTSSGRAMPVAVTGRLTGTVTGSIQARALIRDVAQANDTTFDNGVITVLVHPS